MAHFVAVVIAIGICIGFLALIFLGIKRNSKLSKAQRVRSGNKVALGGLILFLLFKFGDSYVAHTDSETKTKKAEDIFQQAVVLMGQSVELKECKKRIEAGEFKTHVLAYVNCQEPFMIAAYKTAGVRHDDSLQSISKIWQEMLAKADKGDPFSKDDVAKFMMDVVRRDQSEP